MSDDAVPFPAKRAMQQLLWERCISTRDNEWTTWSDSIVLAEVAAEALQVAGWRVVPLDNWHESEIEGEPAEPRGGEA